MLHNNTLLTYAQEDWSLTSALNFFAISEFEIVSEINHHSKMYVNGIVDFEHNTTAVLNTDIVVYLNPNKCIFSGVIKESKIVKENDIYLVVLDCVGSTILLDEQINSQSFLDVNMTYRKILGTVIDQYGGSILMNGKEDKLADHGIIQYNETDWEFVLRLASYLKTIVIPQESSDPNIRLGFPKQSNHCDVPSSIKKHVFDENNSYIELKTYKNLDIALGDRIKSNHTGYIVKKTVLFTQGILESTYLISSSLVGLEVALTGNKHLKGVSLEGTVLETKEEKMSVLLDIDRIFMSENNIFFDYAPISGNVLYSMPEVGAKISLYFPNSFEKNAYVSSTFLAPNNNYKNYQEKTMKTPHDKTMKFNRRNIFWGE